MQVRLFRTGLPLRGAIDFGRFFIQDTCFAGRPIINAYELCNTLELAACVLTPEASDRVKAFLSGSGLNPFVSEYFVPTKNGEFRFFLTKTAVHEKNIGLRQQVMKAFWGHGKDISIEAQRKALNTEQWLRYLDYLVDNQDSEQPTADSLPTTADDS